MGKQSAGLLLYRRRTGDLQVLIVHPGGPYYVNKDDGAWSIPKGEFDSRHESAEVAARREFQEETGQVAPLALTALTPIRQKSGKTVHAFAAEGDFDPSRLDSNTFEMEWPRGSGRVQHFPEVDAAAWVDPDTARRKLNPAQARLVDELIARLEGVGAASRR